MGSDDTTQTAAPPARLSRLRWSLQVLWSAGRLGVPPPRWLHVGEVRIGRSQDCDVVFEHDPRVSRLHAVLSVDEHGCTLVDSSANGTFVQGRATTRQRLCDGDVVRVGDSFLLCRQREPASLDTSAPGRLLGSSPAMVALRRTIALVGPTAAFVLILGETGTGKELVARELHAAYRPEGPFVPVNCGAIPQALAESAFFGHIRGAFSGADSAQPGYFREADGGVLFLDEIGELPPSLQPKLLRSLEDKTVTPVGSTRPTACDVRVLAATNRELRHAAHSGAFRGDLYSRLAELTLRTPPLRERREDVLPILAAQLGADAPPLAAELVAALLAYDWPFNVRELCKLATELRIRGAGHRTLERELVAERLASTPAAAAALPAPPVEVPAGTTPTRSEVEALLKRHHGRVADVARATGRSRKQIYRWLERYALDLDRFREDDES